jgi:hypothetical protein
MNGRGAATPTARRFSCRLGLGLLAAAALWAPQAKATERALSLYLLGSGGPQTAIMPPLKGVYFENIFYNYDGSASAAREFEFNGIVVAGVHAEYPLDFPAVVFVPTTDLFGGTLAVGAVLPWGAPFVHVDTIITGPRGGVFTPQRSDSAVVVGDPLTTAALGWKQGNFHEQVSTIINYPIGEYRVRRLANLALHRWAEDVSFAGSWHDDKAGWDVSAKAGVTWNGENGSSDYISGTESHYEVSVEKIVSKIFSVGLQAYRFDQLTGDTGSGDHIGPFKGEVSGFGGTAAWNVPLGDKPATVRVRGFHEVEAVNRLEGSAVFLELSFPINMQTPPAPPPGAAHP